MQGATLRYATLRSSRRAVARLFAVLCLMTAVLSASAQNADTPAPTPNLYAALKQPNTTSAPDAPIRGQPPAAIASDDNANPRTNTFVIYWRPPASANTPGKGGIFQYKIQQLEKTYNDSQDPARCGTPELPLYAPSKLGYALNAAVHTASANAFSFTITASANANCLSWEVRAVNKIGESAPLFMDAIVSTRRLASNKGCSAGQARVWGGSQTRQPADPKHNGDGKFVSGGDDAAVKGGPRIETNPASAHFEYRQGSCNAGHHVEYGDWCNRLNYTHGDAGRRIWSKAVYSSSTDDKTVSGQNGVAFHWFCYIEGTDLGSWHPFHESSEHPGGPQNVCGRRALAQDAGGYGQDLIESWVPTLGREEDTVCAMNDTMLNNEGEPRATNCGAFAEYNFQHRECQCRGLADNMTSARRQVGVEDRVIHSCQCRVAGVEDSTDGSCECPAGEVYHADLNACGKPAAKFTFAAAPSGTVRPGELVTLAVTVSAAGQDPTGRFYVFSGASDVPLPGCDRVELHPTGNDNQRAGQCAVRFPLGDYELWAGYQLTNPNLRANGTAGRIVLSATFAHTEADCQTKSPWGNLDGGRFIFYRDNDDVYHHTCRLTGASFHQTGDTRCLLRESSVGVLNLPVCVDLFERMTTQGCLARGLLFKAGAGGISGSPPADLTCVCPNGAAPPCIDADRDLLAEIRKANPNLATVRALVAAGANANGAYAANNEDLIGVSDREGWPILFIAAARGHAEVVSVLVTFGADPKARGPAADFSLPFANFIAVRYGFPVTMWTAAENVLRHFGGALDAKGADYDWNARQVDTNPAHGLARNYRALDHLSSGYNAASAADKPVIERMADYIWARGGECQDFFYLGETGSTQHPLCFGTNRRRCENAVPGINPIGGRWVDLSNDYGGSCSFRTTDLSTRDGLGFSCSSESECERIYAQLRAADCVSDPDLQYVAGIGGGVNEYYCGCQTTREVPPENGCPTLADIALLAEVRKADPDLAVVRAQFDASPPPDLDRSEGGGAPPLIIAATLGHAEVVSVLITAGANPTLSYSGGQVQHHMAVNGVESGADAPPISWRLAALVLIHYGDAVARAGKSAMPDWNAPGFGGTISMDDLLHRYNTGGSDVVLRGRAMQEMANYVWARGGRCGGGGSGPICSGETIPSCPASSPPPGRFSCRDCPGYAVRSVDGGECRARGANQCGAIQVFKEAADSPWLEPGCVCVDGFVEVGGECFPSNAPGAPGDVRLTLIGQPGAPQVSLDWTVPDGNGLPLVSYGFWTLALSPSSPPDCSDVEFGADWLEGAADFRGGSALSASEVIDIDPADYGKCAVFALRAESAAGSGPATVSRPVYIQHPPDAPSTLAATLLAGDNVSLSWSPPVSLRGAVSLDYVILRQANNTGGFASAGEAAIGASVFVDDDGPPAGTIFRYKVRVRSSAGSAESDLSNAVGSCPSGTSLVEDVCAFPPAAPGDFRITLVGGSGALRVSLSWTIADDGGPTVSGHEIRVAAGGPSSPADCSDAYLSNLFTTTPSAAADTWAIFPPLVEDSYGRCVRYELRAVSAAGGSARVFATLYLQHPPEAPTRPVVTHRAGSADVSWSGPFNLRGAVVYGYEILRADDGADEFTRAGTVGRFDTRFTDGSLPSNSVRYRVRARTSAGESPLSPVSALLCVGDPNACMRAPDAPGEFNVVMSPRVGSNPLSVSLSWTPPNSYGAPIIRYSYRFRAGGLPAESSDCSEADYGDWSARTDLTQDDLRSGELALALFGLGASDYGTECVSFDLRAHNQFGAGQLSPTLGVYIQHPPDAPSGLSAPLRAEGRLTLTWRPPTVLRGAVLRDYVILRAESGAGAFVSVGMTLSGAGAFVDDAPPPGSTVRYKARLRSSAASVESAPSNWVQVAGLPDAPVLRAALINRAGASSLTLSLSWTAPDDNGSPLTGYGFWRSVLPASSPPDCSAESWPRFSGPSSSSPPGSPPGSTPVSATSAAVPMDADEYGRCHLLGIRAVNAVGDGSIGYFTVYIQQPPDAPSDVSATLLADGRMSLSWSPPSVLRGAVSLDYVILRKVGGGAFVSLTVASASADSFVDDNSPPGGRVRYKLRLRSSAGTVESEPTACMDGLSDFHGECGRNAPPGAVENLRLSLSARADGRAGIASAWEAPSAEDDELPVWYYNSWVSIATPDSPLDCSGVFAAEWPGDEAGVVVAAGTTVEEVGDFGDCFVFAASAVNAAGGGATVTIGPTYVQLPPDAPLSLSATLLAGGNVSLSWDAPVSLRGAVISGYDVLRAVDSGSFVSVGMASVLFFSDNDPPPGSTLRYKVRARSSAGDGPLSESAATITSSGTPVECAEGFTRVGGECGKPPDAPGDFRITLIGELDAPTLSLSWTIPDDNGLALSGHSLSTSFGPASSSPECSDADLSDGSETSSLSADASLRAISLDSSFYGNCYRAALHSINAAGDGPTVVATIYIQASPDAPSNVSATLLADGNVSLSWDEPVSLRGAVISDYEVLRAADSGAFVSVGTASVLFFSDDTPPPGSTLRYKIRARSSAGDGLLSESSAEITSSQPAVECAEGFAEVDGECRQPPEAPGDFRITLIGELDAPTLSLSWTIPDDNGLALSGHSLSTSFGPASSPPECSDADLSDGSETSSLSADASSRVIGLDSDFYGNCYRAELYASNAAGDGPTVAATIYIQASPDAPSNVSATLLADGNVSLSWDAPVSLRGAVVSGYEVLRAAGAAGAFVSVGTASVLFFSDDTPPLGSTLRYKIRARSSAGDGLLSESSAEITSSRPAVECAEGFSEVDGECRQPPDAPGDFRITLIGELDAPTLSLSWTIPDDNGLALSGHSLSTSFGSASSPECSDADLSDGSETSSLSVDVSSRVIGLDSDFYGACYRAALHSINAAGGGPTVAATIYIQASPDAPSNVSATLLADGGASLSWDAPVVLRGAMISGYEILRASGDSEVFVLVGATDASALSFSDEDLSSGVAFRYKVRARSSAGDGLLSESSEAITTEGEAVDYTALLAAEVALTSTLDARTPDAMSVAVYLENGADPDVTISFHGAGNLSVAILVDAALRGHSVVVSLLLARGADSGASLLTLGWSVPHLAANNLRDAGDFGLGWLRRLSWAEARDVLFAFGAGLEAGGAGHDWDSLDAQGRRALEYLPAAYADAEPAERRILYEMSAYMRSRGAGCDSDFDEAGHLMCVGCGADQEFSDGSCACLDGGEFAMGFHCVPKSGDVGAGKSKAELRALCADVFGGEEPVDAGNDEWVCSGIDVIDTFCILGSADAFPCEGLFKHVRDCNYLNRPALDPFFCGPVCAPGLRAMGADCAEW